MRTNEVSHPHVRAVYSRKFRVGFGESTFSRDKLAARDSLSASVGGSRPRARRIDHHRNWCDEGSLSRPGGIRPPGRVFEKRCRVRVICADRRARPVVRERQSEVVLLWVRLSLSGRYVIRRCRIQARCGLDEESDHRDDIERHATRRRGSAVGSQGVEGSDLSSNQLLEKDSFARRRRTPPQAAGRVRQLAARGLRCTALTWTSGSECQGF